MASVNPRHAALASMLSFILGAVIPLLTIVLTLPSFAVPLIAIAVTITLAVTQIRICQARQSTDTTHRIPQHTVRQRRNDGHNGVGLLVGGTI